jgi:glycosyltransferase involved in cell wall biosynthesis
LVNDHSDDEGPEFLKFREQGNMQLLDLDQRSGKKAAIEVGIKAANHSFLIFTDADCKPMSSQWIKQMVKPLLAGKQIVVGYSGFYPKSTLLNAFQRYENCMNSLQNAASISRGRAYMAIGRNLAYRKEILKSRNIFKQGIRSGDDDLLVNRLSENGNTEFVGGIEGQTISRASSSWIAYFFQRRRQLEAGKYYKNSDRFKLAVLGISQLMFNLLFITQLIRGDELSIILGIFAVKLILQLLVLFKPMNFLGEGDLWWQTPLLEIIYFPIISLIGISQYLYKVDRWK